MRAVGVAYTFTCTYNYTSTSSVRSSVRERAHVCLNVFVHVLVRERARAERCRAEVERVLAELGRVDVMRPALEPLPRGLVRFRRHAKFLLLFYDEPVVLERLFVPVDRLAQRGGLLLQRGLILRDQPVDVLVW